jgi:hypothetical protein
MPAHLLPAGTDDQFPPAEVPELLIGVREFSQCMRSHRVPTWPDPTVDSEGRPGFNLVPSGIDASSSQSPPRRTNASTCCPKRSEGFR